MTLALQDLVERAWCETLEPGVDVTLPWADAGGDSLATLHLLYRLEQELGRELSFDLLQPEMTQADLVAALVHGIAALPFTGVRVFMVPGIYGDGPSLSSFRRGLAGRIAIELVELPPLDAPAALAGDVVASGRAVAAEIAARQPDGPLFIGGYSFGGSVALEAAEYLAATGRQLAMVAVFDAHFGEAVLGRAGSRWRRARSRLATVAMTPRLPRRAVLAVAERAAPETALRLRRWLTRRLRTQARMRWRPAATTLPLWIAVSDEFERATVPVWRSLCPDAAIVPVPGTHFGLFRGDALDVVSRAFEAAVGGLSPARA